VDWRDEEVDVGAMVRRVSATVEPLFHEKDLPLVVETEPHLPVVHGDRHRLEQVVINLLSNAAKFTSTGVVTVRAGATPGHVVVSVTDTGPGIAAEDVPDLFVRFRQVGDTLTDKPQGTGLGLAICHEIVEHHGGRIDVDSEPGRGSTFAVTLPTRVGS
jgi:signal transduction histidine kinase